MKLLQNRFLYFVLPQCSNSKHVCPQKDYQAVSTNGSHFNLTLIERVG